MSCVSCVHIDEIKFLCLKGCGTDPGPGDCIKIRAHFVGINLGERHTRKIPGLMAHLFSALSTLLFMLFVTQTKLLTLFLYHLTYQILCRYSLKERRHGHLLEKCHKISGPYQDLNCDLKLQTEK